MSSSQLRHGKRRFDDDESTFLKRDRHRRRLPSADLGSEAFGLPEGDRWPTCDQAAPTERGARNRTRTGCRGEPSRAASTSRSTPVS